MTKQVDTATRAPHAAPVPARQLAPTSKETARTRGPLPRDPATLLALQRTIGNRAVQRMISHRAVQRYIPVDLDGTIDMETYETRAQSAEKQFTGFNMANRGWLEVQLPAGQRVKYFAESREGQHTEERLLAEIQNVYPTLDFQTSPGAPQQHSVIALYTERQPCDDNALDDNDPRRTREDENCDALLHRVLHDDVKVFFSVSNEDFDDLRLRMIEMYGWDVAMGHRVPNASYTHVIQDKHMEWFSTSGRNYSEEKKQADASLSNVTKAYDTTLKLYFPDIPHNKSKYYSEFLQGCALIRMEIDVGADDSAEHIKRIKDLEQDVIQAIKTRYNELKEDL